MEANRTVTIDVTLEVGVGEMVVEVSATADELLIKDSPIHGGNIALVAITISSMELRITTSQWEEMLRDSISLMPCRKSRCRPARHRQSECPDQHTCRGCADDRDG